MIAQAILESDSGKVHLHNHQIITCLESKVTTKDNL